MAKNQAQREAMKFQLRLGDWINDVLPEYINEAKKVVALDALRGIVMKNPVDTSRSQSNWNVTINSPSEKADYDRFDNSPGAVISRGETTINQVRVGQNIWISNNIYYIVKLERDHTPMVGLTLQELQLRYA